MVEPPPPPRDHPSIIPYIKTLRLRRVSRSKLDSMSTSPIGLYLPIQAPARPKMEKGAIPEHIRQVSGVLRAGRSRKLRQWNRTDRELSGKRQMQLINISSIVCTNHLSEADKLTFKFRLAKEIDSSSWVASVCSLPLHEMRFSSRWKLWSWRISYYRRSYFICTRILIVKGAVGAGMKGEAR
jgi:hypothetical protein